MTPDEQPSQPEAGDGSPGTDSAGQTWGGRALSSTGFDGDTGEVDAALALALHDPSRERELMTAVAAARLLVPVVAEPVTVDASGEHTVEKQTDMAAVTLTAPDGQRALPVFTSLESLNAWEPGARPVPVTASRAGQAAVFEGCDVIVLDVSGPRSAVLRPSMVWALAQERPWLPAHEDPVVARAVAAAVAPEPSVRGHATGPGHPAGEGILQVELELDPGLAAEQVQEIATRVGERLATDGELRARVDGLSFSIR